MKDLIKSIEQYGVVNVTGEENTDAVKVLIKQGYKLTTGHGIHGLSILTK